MILPLMMGAGIVLSAYSKYRAGQARAQEIRMQRYQELYNARMAELDAIAMGRKTDFEQLRQLREAEEIMGSMRVRQAVSGARTDVGAPLLVRQSQWAELELENFLIGLKGRTQKSKYEMEATMHKIQAGYLRSVEKSAKRAGKLAAATTILGGFGTMGAMGAFSGGGGATAPASLTTPRGPTGMGY